MEPGSCVESDTFCFVVSFWLCRGIMSGRTDEEVAGRHVTLGGANSDERIGMQCSILERILSIWREKGIAEEERELLNTRVIGRRNGVVEMPVMASAGGAKVIGKGYDSTEN